MIENSEVLDLIDEITEYVIGWRTSKDPPHDVNSLKARTISVNGFLHFIQTKKEKYLDKERND